MTTKGCRTGGGNNYDGDYNPPEMAAATASSDLDTAVPFGLRGKEATVTSTGHEKLTFAVFYRGSILVLVFVIVNQCLY